MRSLVCLVAVVVAGGCGSGGMKPKATACTAANADPGVCLVIAKERLARQDEAGAREYVDHLVTAINAAPACLRDHKAEGCFAGVVALLREKPVGLLARYDMPEDLLDMVPRWTGSDATGSRVQARTALHGMCVVPGRDPIAQQRACIVLGDLVEDERVKRCGPSCDVSNKDQLGGWSTAEVIDGYAAACKLAQTERAGVTPARGASPRIDAKAQTAFGQQIIQTYQVSGPDPVCAVAASSMRGASIPEALASRDRIKNELRAREASAGAAAKRETERMAAMEKSKAAAAVAAAKAEQAAFSKEILATIQRSNWPLTFGLLTKHRGSPIDDTVATAINKIFEPFAEWAIGQSSVAAAYLDLSSRLALAPKDHAIRVSLATFRERALVEAKAVARKARGVGGVWLHAAIVARIAGPTGPAEAAAAQTAYTKLVASVRTSLVLESVPPACAPIIKPSPAGGRTVKAKAALTCTLEPERKTTVKEPYKVKQHVVGPDGEHDVEHESMVDVTHRTYKVVVHGVLAVYSGAPRRAVQIDFEEIVDDVDGSDARKFDAALATATDLVVKATVGSLEHADAAKAHAAALQALKYNRREAAENQLVFHALLAGSSPELDEVMASYGVSFAELLPR